MMVNTSIVTWMQAVSINEFLKPAEGERSYNPGRGGRGRGRGRGGYGSGYGSNARDVAAPSIEDPGQFPSLGGKWDFTGFCHHIDFPCVEFLVI